MASALRHTTGRPQAAGGPDPLAMAIKSIMLNLSFGLVFCPGVLCPSAALGNDSTINSPTTQTSDAVVLADQYVSTVSTQLKLEAETAAQQKIADRLEAAIRLGSPGHNVLKQLQAADEDLKKVMAGLLQENDDLLIDALNQVGLELKLRETDLETQWRAVRTSLNAKRIQLFEVKASQQLAGQLAFLMSANNRWFWLFGLLAIGSLAGATVHDRRHEIRRRLNGGKARAMGLSKFLAVILALLTVITAATFIFGDRVFHLLLVASTGEETSPRDEIAGQNEVAAENLEDTTRNASTASSRYTKALRQTKASLQSSAPSSTKLIDQWEATVVQSQAVEAALQVQSDLSTRLKTDIAQLNQLQESVTNTAEQTAKYHRIRQYICAGLGVTLLGLATGGGILFQRGVHRRKEKISNTCPLCLGEGTFVSLDDEPRGDYTGLNMVQCKNVISEQPYEECDFIFTSMYRDITKLCFPTLGIPQAGKTHWLAMVYRELNRGNYPRFVQFERMKSSSSDNFDIVVDEILNRKLGPAATQTGRIPYPLVFNFLDRDRFGVSDILVNIFDYSGEVIRSQTLQDRQRQRALDGDGFFFFLDPTEPSETQSEALAGFREDLRRIKGVKAGGQIRTPVALCVSKIDLMVNEPYADPNGGGVVGNFYRDLGEVGWNTDLPSIQARSRLVARLRDTIWPGWQIERQIHELFGGRYMFFPLTPVGLNGLGEMDLARRTIAPVGLLDPLLWLLHMNGYPVLS
jgi:hypothetical protein